MLAPAEYMEKYLDITPGSVSVMGLMNDKENDVKLLVDEDMFATFLEAVHHDYITVKLVGEE